MNTIISNEENFELEVQSTIQLFKDAEARIKDRELFYDDGLYVPAINELRYAGRHIIDALAKDDIDSKLEEVFKAQKHCKRALYDASEACLIDAYEQFKNFQARFEILDLRKYVENYDLMLAESHRIKERVANRATDETKEEFYEDLTALHSSFSTHFMALEAKESDLKAARHTRLYTYRGLTATIVIGVLTIVTTLASPIVTKYAETLFPKENYQVDQLLIDCINYKGTVGIDRKKSLLECGELYNAQSTSSSKGSASKSGS